MKNPARIRAFITRDRTRSFEHEFERELRFKPARHRNTGQEERVASTLRGESNERR